MRRPLSDRPSRAAYLFSRTSAGERVLENEPIRDMLAIGAVSPRTARVWVRVDQPGYYTLSWSPALGGAAHQVTLQVTDRACDLTASTTLTRGLDPDTRYRVTLSREPDAHLAAGSFVTAPAGPDREPDHYSIALLSCHQPFNRDGTVAEATGPMLEAVNRAFMEHHVRAVIMGGDQLYSDFPKGASLFDSDHFREVAPPGRETLLDCTEAEVRELFQQRYRHFWNVDGWRELLGNYPCYPILDDHEIVDNWGSASEHHTQPWQAFRRGAFHAYADYQGARICDAHAGIPASFDYHFELAGTAGYVMDLRSNRRAGEQAALISAAQAERFERFLADYADRHTLLVVLSVPLLHLPPGLGRLAAKITPDGEDFSDRWSTLGHRRDRDRVLRLLHDHQRRHPRQRVVLLSGDIHIGCVHQIRWRDGPSSLYQFISSGITHDAGRFVQRMSSALIRANRAINTSDETGRRLEARLRLLPGQPGARRNPCGRLNVGIMEFRREQADAAPSLRFLLYSHDGAQPRCLYRSPPVPPPEAPRAGVTRPASQADR